MNGLSLYILRQTGGPLLIFTFSLTGLVWLTQSLRLLDVIVNQGQSAWTFLQLAVLLLPSLVALILPVALFFAVVFALHRMQTDSEIVVMWSAGFGRWSVARPVLFIALWVTILGYAMGLYLMPAGMRAFKDRVFEIRGDLVSVLLREGSFTTPAEGLTAYVRETTREGEIRNILVEDSRKAGEPVTYIAERGRLAQTPSGPRLVMWHGTVQRLTGEKRLALLDFDRYTIDLSQFASSMTGKLREPTERYLGELLFPDPTNGWDVQFWDRLIAEGHSRLASPLYAVALAMIGLAGLMCGHITRRGYAQRIAAVVLVAFLARLAGFGLQNAAAKLPLLNAVQYFLPLSCIAVSALMLDHRFDILLDRLRPRAATSAAAE